MGRLEIDELTQNVSSGLLLPPLCTGLCPNTPPIWWLVPSRNCRHQHSLCCGGFAAVLRLELQQCHRSTSWPW